MANEDIIRRAPLAPPNSPTITAADRSRVYDLIGRELNGALNGEASFHPDGKKKGSADLMSNLNGLIGTVASLKEAVNDPTNIFASRSGGFLRRFQRRDQQRCRGDVGGSEGPKGQQDQAA